MNTNTLRNKLQRLETRARKNREDTAQIVIRTCWGNEDVHVAPNVTVIKTQWGSTRLARAGNEEFDE